MPLRLVCDCGNVCLLRSACCGNKVDRTRDSTNGSLLAIPLSFHRANVFVREDSAPVSFTAVPIVGALVVKFHFLISHPDVHRAG